MSRIYITFIVLMNSVASFILSLTGYLKHIYHLHSSFYRVSQTYIIFILLFTGCPKNIPSSFFFLQGVPNINNLNFFIYSVFKFLKSDGKLVFYKETFKKDIFLRNRDKTSILAHVSDALESLINGC